jgi:hypothetical protein
MQKADAVGFSAPGASVCVYWVALPQRYEQRNDPRVGATGVSLNWARLGEDCVQLFAKISPVDRPATTGADDR